MIRLPVSPARIASRVQLTDAEHHYLVDVLRLKAPATLEVFDGAGVRYPALLVDDRHLQLGAACQEARPKTRLVLAQGLAKADKMDLVIQKATELGVDAIAPFSSAHAVVRLEGERAVERVKRWQRIAQAAARQCGRADTPEVWEIVPLRQLLQKTEFAMLVLYEGEQADNLRDALSLIADRPILLLVGPEGGFGPEEIGMARQAGARVITLGRRVLRTETAGLVALGVIQFLEGNLG